MLFVATLIYFVTMKRKESLHVVYCWGIPTDLRTLVHGTGYLCLELVQNYGFFLMDYDLICLELTKTPKKLSLYFNRNFT